MTRTITLVFDGGSRGNPGEGYGSYLLDFGGGNSLRSGRSSRLAPSQVVRLRLGDRMTNNEAEYDTLIAALEALLAELQRAGEKPQSFALEVRGDSQLVMRQLAGEWRTHEPRLAQRRDKARRLLSRFARYQLVHQPRAASLALLGH